MPFQDPQDLQVQPLRPRSGDQPWWHKVLFEDWGLKILALLITFVLWFAISGQRKPVTKRFVSVQLSFLAPESLEISNEPPSRVDITLTGSSDLLTRINPADIVVTANASDQPSGDRVLHLTADRVQVTVPDGVRVVNCQPATVVIRLEPRIERQVAVDVKLEGNPPDGYEVAGVSSSPAAVRLRGPASHMNLLTKASTETITLEGHKNSFDVPEVSINIPDPKLEIRDATVKVHVDVREKPLQQTQAKKDTTAAATAPVH